MASKVGSPATNLPRCAPVKVSAHSFKISPDPSPKRIWFALTLFSFFCFSSRRRHTRLQGDWSSDVCSSDLFQLSAVITDRADCCLCGKVINTGLLQKA